MLLKQGPETWDLHRSASMVCGAVNDRGNCLKQGGRWRWTPVVFLCPLHAPALTHRLAHISNAYSCKDCKNTYEDYIWVCVLSTDTSAVHVFNLFWHRLCCRHFSSYWHGTLKHKWLCIFALNWMSMYDSNKHLQYQRWWKLTFRRKRKEIGAPEAQAQEQL